MKKRADFAVHCGLTQAPASFAPSVHAVESFGVAVRRGFDKAVSWAALAFTRGLSTRTRAAHSCHAARRLGVLRRT